MARLEKLFEEFSRFAPEHFANSDVLKWMKEKIFFL